MPETVDDIRQAGRCLVGFSPDMAEAERQVKRFLFAKVYRHEDVLAVRRLVAGIVRDLFAAFMEKPDNMPAMWTAGIGTMSETDRARRVCDYIAGMTDRYAIDEHRRLFDDTPDLG